jgi:hypothetical protein
LALRPGTKGTVIIKSVFSSQDASRVANATKHVENLLNGNRLFAEEVIDKVKKARDMFKTGNDIERAASGEFNFLIHAVKKLKK